MADWNGGVRTVGTTPISLTELLGLPAGRRAYASIGIRAAANPGIIYIGDSQVATNPFGYLGSGDALSFSTYTTAGHILTDQLWLYATNAADKCYITLLT